MQYLQEVIGLATHYPYPYDVCYYVYMAHGDKAEELLNLGAQNKLSGYSIMSVSDVVMGHTEKPYISFEELCKNQKKVKLPKKFLKGWF